MSAAVCAMRGQILPVFFKPASHACDLKIQSKMTYIIISLTFSFLDLLIDFFFAPSILAVLELLFTFFRFLSSLKIT